METIVIINPKFLFIEGISMKGVLTLQIFLN
jgi:hypothetical protein